MSKLVGFFFVLNISNVFGIMNCNVVKHFCTDSFCCDNEERVLTYSAEFVSADQAYTKTSLVNSKQAAMAELANLFDVTTPTLYADGKYYTKLMHDKEVPLPSVFNGVLNMTKTFAFEKSEETFVPYTLVLDPITAMATGSFASATPTEAISIFASQIKDGYIYLWGELQFASLYSKYIAYQQLFPSAGISLSE